MTERDIQFRLFYELKPFMAAPNIMMYGCYESDLLAVTANSMFAHEYEIKLSKSDFLADFKKCDQKFTGVFDIVPSHYGGTTERPVFVTKTKHQELLEGELANQFTYCFPEGLIDHALVPEWAGIVEVIQFENKITLNLVRNAKMLHKNKMTDRQITQMARSLSFRAFKI